MQAEIDFWWQMRVFDFVIVFVVLCGTLWYFVVFCGTVWYVVVLFGTLLQIQIVFQNTYR